MADLNIGDLTYGISYSGISQYKEEIRSKCLVEVQNLINEHKANVRKAIDAGWNRESAERFKELFNKRCDELSEALKSEYYDLESRLNELTTNYINQDKNMIIE